MYTWYVVYTTDSVEAMKWDYVNMYSKIQDISV